MSRELPLLLFLQQKERMYSEYPPCTLLSAYIDKYWEFKGKPEYGMRIHILPDGCTDFIFTLGEVAQPVNGNQMMQPFRSYFVGPMSKYSQLVTYADTVHMFGIRFLPAGIFRFMNLPLEELANQRINTKELISPFTPSFTEKLCEHFHLKDRIRLVEELLINALSHEDLTNPQINFAIRQIHLHQGNLLIHNLAETIGLSQRHFERKFKQQTGFTPKEYSRIIKFRQALKLFQQTQAEDLLSIAVQAGYYDTSHLSKEIRALSGKPASSLLNLELPENTSLTYL